MKLWNAFYDHLLPDLPGCTPALADLALRHAAQEFCERTKAWDAWLDPLTLTASVQEYDLEVAATEEVVKLLAATLDGNEFRVLSANDLPADWKTHPGAHRGCFTLDRRSLWVLPALTGKLALRVALKPSHAATGVSDALFAHHLDDIATGAKARLMLSPKKPYTDGALGKDHRADFEARCAAIARRVEKSFSRTPRRSVARFF